MGDVGEIVREGRDGKPVVCLHCDDGTRAAAEGRDLASVCRGLTMDRLIFWRGRLSRGVTPHERGIVQAEIDRRDPRRAYGTLWEFAT